MLDNDCPQETGEVTRANDTEESYSERKIVNLKFLNYAGNTTAGTGISLISIPA